MAEIEYDVRYLALALVNMFLRPQFCLFFTDYTASTFTLFKIALYTLFSLIFLFTSFNTPQTSNSNNARSGNCRRPLRIGYSEWSALLTVEFIFSLLCPTSVFYYAHPIIIYSSLHPDYSLNQLRALYRRIGAALSAFISCTDNNNNAAHDLPSSSSTTTSIDTPTQRQVEDHPAGQSHHQLPV